MEAAPGERAGLSLRVTPVVKKRLERAAEKNGRSLSQEAELRLERSFERETRLTLAKGDAWAPILVHTWGLEVWTGEGKYQVVNLKISPDDLGFFLKYFGAELFDPAGDVR